MGSYCVYVHTNQKNGKRYVGITSQNVSRRWKNGHGYYENEHFYRAICKDGWDNFTHEIIKAGLSKEDACDLEKKLIAEYRSNEEIYGYNKSTGGESTAYGIVHSEATKQKMSKSHIGIVFSEERCKHMSEAAKKRGNGLNGHTGEKSSVSGLVRQISIETGEVIDVFYGFYEMTRKTGFSRSPVVRATCGKQRQAYGYRWEYVPRRKTDVTPR